MENFWPTCLSRLEQELSTQQFNTWIKPLSAEIDGNTVRLVAPNRFVMQWVKERFLKKIEQFAYELKLTDIQIDFTISNNDSDAESKSSTVKSNAKVDFTHKINLLESQVATRSSPLKAQHKKINDAVKNNSGLNSDFNFDNYVTGRANQLARAAAIQVAENPGNAYNPLFIYGGVGLGKTHLLQAIGNELKLHNPDAKIRYLHAERYVSDVVKAYEHKAFDEFKRQYHSLDLLLIDDIQFFAKKTRTQEEFFYAFNSLIEAKKQIVITCDTYPKEIIDVDERLRTRFSWGLTVAVEPPELEMRVAILLKKAEAVNLKLPEDVAFFIAKQIRSSVRELEGALNRIIAMAKFTGHAIDVHLAKDALRDLIAVRGRQVTMENIQKTVADYYKIKVAEMYSKKRTRNFARPRQIAMALSRELTNHSFPEIGEAFGGRHHTTVMHACDEVDLLRQNDPTFTRDISFLVQVIRD
ncbi:chromosomal replication initiator protein DnaA [Methylotenera sp.]|uniref:chromosomal replication initiator protein DnaA n=1 Tax=Methylotenera sp. TaxID=2051956 RepID=UPI002725E7EE|nr:chromosomal replication initiator protein DnaA [Methylotenera sp.]MDO9203898.1 chromosomal replication initiator protein DnaA [Methylotenera sp.]MDP1522472.1 chromosomal replication initiator protein DnaA [Methylotenera sp.]MDP2072438.1 chromosomal replication initiator protein DnaA [Methylotenera sp.]MDP3006256.1 chromosomal replication initiator protein DnaA [Methylotenera sp.]MDP3307450.1 chromosomal replication initiator protein DnaA [Methylotenera sp.]